MNQEITASYLNKASIDYPDTQKLRVFAVGQRNVQIFIDFVKKSMGIQGVSIEISCSVHFNPEIEIYNPQSQLYSFQPDVLYFGMNEYDTRSTFYDKEQRERWAEEQLNGLQKLRGSLNQNGLGECLLLVDNLIHLPDSVSNVLKEDSFEFQCQKFNWLLLNWGQVNDKVMILDKAILAANSGIRNILNSSMKWNLCLPFSLDFEAKLAWDLTRNILNLIGKQKKCLVLDLDDTLWGGTLGDDGMAGIVLSGVEGRPFVDLQKWVKNLCKQGVIIAINSKNEIQIAEEVFKSHPDMILDQEDVSIFIANWNKKDENILVIQDKLNIGLDSMVFVDNDPMEREWVKAKLPDVVVPDLPDDPNLFVDFLQSLKLFDPQQPGINRNQFYKNNSQRESEKERSNSLEEFLKGLKLKGAIKKDDLSKVERVSELSLRTNQFNLTGDRLSAEQVRNHMIDEDKSIISVELEDKFGDYGLIGYIHLTKESDKLVINNWCVSCRAFQRGVEQLMMNTIVSLAKKHGLKVISGVLIGTSRNKVVENLYRSFSFNEVEKQKWEIAVANYKTSDHFISFNSFIL